MQYLVSALFIIIAIGCEKINPRTVKKPPAETKIIVTERISVLISLYFPSAKERETIAEIPIGNPEVDNESKKVYTA